MIFYQQHENDFSIVECATMYFPPHLHKQIEIMACFEGKMKVTCDFHTYELKSGDWLIDFRNVNILMWKQKILKEQ